MVTKKRVLWIEDGSRGDFVDLIAPVIVDGNYDLDVAETVTEGIFLIRKNKYDVLIVDIRIPPGEDQDWINLYQKSAEDKISARLGLQLLYSLLGHTDAIINISDKPEWIKREIIGVLSVEGHQELNGDLDKLGVTCYFQKKSNTADDILIQIIQIILNNDSI